jgi:hypothetical protein
VLIPADKTKVLTIMPSQTVIKEIEIHLNDNTTYRLLNKEEYEASQNVQIQTVADAIKYFRTPTILVKHLRHRTIYMLPKIHKELNEWRTHLYHPKMRPIISDVNSITSNLASYLLPVLQKIEQKLLSTITSSLQVVNDLHNMNHNNQFIQTPLLCTIDVESLFTKIPLDKLLQILNTLLSQFMDNSQLREKYMNYLQVIILNNSFINKEKFYLQITGLPMGGKLSGSLANIYLGFIEKHVIFDPGIILFRRYMDDICIIWRKNSEELISYILQLEKLYNLKITYSFNHHSITFLDLTICNDPTKRQYITYPYSKRFPLYPLTSTFTSPDYFLEKSII